MPELPRCLFKKFIQQTIHLFVDIYNYILEILYRFTPWVGPTLELRSTYDEKIISYTGPGPGDGSSGCCGSSSSKVTSPGP